jgi:3-hydroxyacyl-[acyl-carrier-protein] dehydratase
VRFILVDEIITLAPGDHVHGVKTLDPGDELFRDHFPGFSVVPGVLLTEMMAQAAGKCLDAADETRKAMLVQIQKASFRRWVRPGERADIRARITARETDYATAQCRIDVGGEEAARADLMFAFVARADLSPDYRDEVLDAFRRRSRLD